VITTASNPQSNVVEATTKATHAVRPIANAAVVEVATKMDIATEIFKRMNKNGATRKEILDVFVAEAKLSKAGASTYYQLIKAKVK
jgi:hypothetical protein